MYGPSVAFVSPTASLLFVRNHLLDAVSISSDWLGWGNKKTFHTASFLIGPILYCLPFE